MTATLPEHLCDFTFGMLFAAQIFCTAIMYLKGKTHNLQKAVFHFMAWLLTISVVEAVFFLPSLSSTGRYSYLTSPVTDILEMTVVPAALLLFLRIVDPQRRRGWLLPANALVYTASLVAFCITGYRIIYHVTMTLTILYSVFIIAYGFVATRRYNRILKENFSDDTLSLYWLKYILYVYMGIICLWTWASLSETLYAVSIYNLCMIVFFGLICYFSYKQDDMLEALRMLNSDDSSKGQASRSYGFEDNLESLFREKEIYLDPKLTISGLARALGTNRTYVSNFLNSQMHTNFYEYVNGWRIKKAKDLLTTTSLPLETVAGESGFNSISSFRRYFTATCGISPSAYRKRSH
jgi:AraC-like DNA-binding protein